VPESPGERRRNIDRHAPAAVLFPADRQPAEVYFPPDSDLDLFCVACTPELGEHGWQHDRSCVLGRCKRTA
jgi:hypothetical protein